MNVAGPLAAFIFAITICTVFGGLFAYGVYKVRERKRKPAAKASGRAPLQYFVEYVVIDAVATAPAVATRVKARPAFLWIGVAVVALGSFGVAASNYIAEGRRVVMRGAWGENAEPSARSTSAPQAPRESVRAGAVDLRNLSRRAPSLFVSPRYDLNGDGQLQNDERTLIHDRVPQFVVVTCDDNGSVQGMTWLRQTFEKVGRFDRMTFFLTANYLENRSAYQGGPVSQWWSTLGREATVGIHGTSHAEGGENWPEPRWFDENSTAQGEVIRALGVAPEPWTWRSYPWGSRAPFLAASQEYFASLDRLDYRIAYDASLVARSGNVPSMTAIDVRDAPWPFTLDNLLPADVFSAFNERAPRSARLSSRGMWEFPVYAWVFHPGTSPPRWETSFDASLFAAFPCKGEGPNDDAVQALVENLRAHYRGNRAPFHLGLQAQNYAGDKVCERATIREFVNRVERMVGQGLNIRHASIPGVIAWLDEVSVE